MGLPDSTKTKDAQSDLNFRSNNFLVEIHPVQ